MEFDNAMALDFELDRFRIAKVWQRFFPAWDLDGVIAARGQLSGTFGSPVIDMAGDVSELEFEGESYGDLEGNISYRDRLLYVESAELDNRYFHASASGTFPIDLSFDSVASRVLNTQPLTGRLEASGDNLDPVNRFLPQTIESVRGDFALQAGVTGTPQSPRFSGQATLAQGTIKTVEIVNPLENVVVDVALRHDTVVIRSASAVVRDKKLAGRIDVKGTMRIGSIKSFDYDLQVTGRGVPARMEFEDFFVLADFDLSVFGPTPPKVIGKVRPKRIEDREPLTETEETPIYDTSLWDWDIAIELPSGGYSIRNDQLEAELSADLRLLRERGQPSYIGAAEFVRGKVYLFDKVGRIKRGVLTFDDPLKADPRLDIDVGFRIQQPRVQTRTEASPSPVIDLNLHIGGRASEPLIDPEAPYSEQDVLLLLAANMTTLGGGDSLAVSDPLANRLKFAATGLVFSEVQRAAARKLGLETLEINSGGSPFDASITVGRYFSPQLYLYGTSPIDAGAGQEVGFEYRLSRRVFLDGNRDKNNLYRMNLHFNWEY
jgi:autotransporter translocation and assembly factor TamB